MLDPELTELARRAIRVALDDRVARLRADLEVIQTTMVVQGLGRSSALIQAVQQLCTRELRARARLVFREFRRVIEAAQAPYTEDLAEALKAEVERILATHTPQLASVLGETAEGIGFSYKAEAQEVMARARIRAAEKTGVEIETFAIGRRREYARLGVPSDEDLVRELRISGLAEAEAIIVKLQTSAAAIQTNLNTCLTDARIALQALAEAVARSIATSKPVSAPGWGPALTYLRVTGYLSERVAEGLAGLHTLVSEGAHKPLVGLTEVETAAFGRRMAVSACYFLIKLHNATRGALEKRT